MHEHVADLLFGPLDKQIDGANNESEKKRFLWWLQPALCHNALNEGMLNVRKNRFWNYAISDITGDKLIKFIARNQKKIYEHETLWQELFEYHKKGVFGKFWHNIRDSGIKDGWDVGSFVNPVVGIIGAAAAGGYNVYKRNKDKNDGVGVFCSYFNAWNSAMREEYDRSILPLINADYKREVDYRAAKQKWFLVHLLVGVVIATGVWLICGLLYEYIAQWSGGMDFLSKSILTSNFTYGTVLTHLVSIFPAFIYCYRLRYNSNILKSILFIMAIILFFIIKSGI